MMKKLLLVGLGSAMILQANAQEASRMNANLQDGQKMSNYSIVKRSPISKSTTSALNVTPIAIGSSVNAFTQVGHLRRRTSANAELNGVLFVHRGDAAVPGQSGNIAVFDYSTDGGSTWTSNVGPVISGDINGLRTRYPQGYLYNPAGNTNVANARVVASAVYATGPNNSWGGLKTGSSKLDGTGAKETTITASDAFISQSLTERIPGEYWMIDDTTIDGNITLYKGVYSVSGDSVAWTTQVLADARSTFEFHGDSARYYDISVAFSPDGQTGWAAVNGDLAPVRDDRTSPIFWKSTDGGATWGAPEQVDLATLAGVIAEFGSVVPTTSFDASLTVDHLGNPHFFFVAGPAASTPYSIGTGITLPIFDITREAGAWVANFVDTVESFRGTIPNSTVTQDNQPTISKSPDGSYIFYSWIDTKLENQDDGSNKFPDLFVKGYHVPTGIWGDKINVTENTSVETIVYLPAVATIATPLANNEFKIHAVVTSFTADENVQVNFSYLDGVNYPMPANAVGINKTKNNLFDVTGNYPNPFSGTTSFDLALNKAADVKVTVSNLLGQVISTELTSLTAGKHTLNINAEGLATGIYTFTVEAGGFLETNKMVVK